MPATTLWGRCYVFFLEKRKLILWEGWWPAQGLPLACGVDRFQIQAYESQHSVLPAIVTSGTCDRKHSGRPGDSSVFCGPPLAWPLVFSNQDFGPLRTDFGFLLFFSLYQAALKNAGNFMAAAVRNASRTNRSMFSAWVVNFAAWSPSSSQICHRSRLKFEGRGHKNEDNPGLSDLVDSCVSLKHLWLTSVCVSQCT